VCVYAWCVCVCVWPLLMCAMTHYYGSKGRVYLRHDSCRCVTWLIHMRCDSPPEQQRMRPFATCCGPAAVAAASLSLGRTPAYTAADVDYISYNESCHTYEWDIPHIWMSHVTHTNEACHPCDTAADVNYILRDKLEIVARTSILRMWWLLTLHHTFNDICYVVLYTNTLGWLRSVGSIKS